LGLEHRPNRKLRKKSASKTKRGNPDSTERVENGVNHHRPEGRVLGRGTTLRRSKTKEKMWEFVYGKGKEGDWRNVIDFGGKIGPTKLLQTAKNRK